MLSAPAIKVSALSETMCCGREHRPINLLKARMKESVVISVTTSKCTARVTAQVNKHIYALLVFELGVL